ncbi:MAG: hypothetical protein RL336_312 [Pseudomonadota bacterium]
MQALAVMPAISSFYIGVNVLLVFVLAIYVVMLRRRHKVGIGDGGVPEMLRAIRVHANALEYVPLALLMLLVMELMGVAALHLHALGLALTLGRLLHAWGLAHSSGTSLGRFIGTLLTWGVFAYAAVICIKVSLA